MTRAFLYVGLPAVLACSTRPDSGDPNETGGGSLGPQYPVEAALQLDDGTDLAIGVQLALRVVADRPASEDPPEAACGGGYVLQTWDDVGLHVGEPTFASLDVGSATRSIDGWWVQWWDGTGDGKSYSHQWLGTYTIEEWGTDHVVFTMTDGTACLFGDTSNCWPANGSLTLEGEVIDAEEFVPSQAAWFDPVSGELLCAAGNVAADSD